MADLILTAGTVITMDEAVPRAAAVAVSGGRIVAVGTVDECSAALPGAPVVDTGVAALAPGFVEPHSHPLISGVATQPPARSIAPWDAPSWADVQATFADALATTDPATPLWFAGYDALLHGHPAPKADELDAIFGDRIAVITDNSGHGVYFNCALIKLQRLGHHAARRSGGLALRTQRRRQPRRAGLRATGRHRRHRTVDGPDG